MSDAQILQLQFLLLIVVIVAVSKFAGHISKRFLNQPVVFGEILAGVIIGPTLLNLFGWPVFSPHEHAEWLEENTHTLAHFGVLLLMFIAGMETNLEQMRKVGKTAFWAAIAGVVLPLGFGMAVGLLFQLSLWESIFIGAVLTATSVSISAQTLMELGWLNSKEGMTILGAAVIDDVLGIIVLSFVIAFSAAGKTEGHAKLSDMAAHALTSWLNVPDNALWSILFVVLFMAAFFAIAVLIGSRLFTPLLEFADRLHASYAVPAVALLLMALFSITAEYFGQVASITGAYIVGVFLARTRFHEKVLHGIQPFTYAMFVPFFFISIGLGVNLRDSFSSGWLFMLVIVVVAVVTKVVGCGAGALFAGFNRQEALRVGAGMVSRGEVGLIVAQVGLAAGVIERGPFGALIIMVLVTTVVTPILLRFTFPHGAEVKAEVFESVVSVETGEEERSY